MDKLIAAIGNLKDRIMIPLDIPEKELNGFLPKDSNEYDRSESFRERLLKAYPGSKIIKLYACYYQGWECDEWAADIEIDGRVFLVETSHGGFYSNGAG